MVRVRRSRGSAGFSSFISVLFFGTLSCQRVAFHLSLELQWIPGPCHCPALIPLLPLSWKDALQWVPPRDLGATGKLFAGGSRHGFYQTESDFYLGASGLELLLGPAYSSA